MDIAIAIQNLRNAPFRNVKFLRQIATAQSRFTLRSKQKTNNLQRKASSRH
ncbi:hypothetical protein AB0H83_51560 [Dactylosporangium sp. NPDC050688]|uniref:hypothetical protein n=1 Tax=Dactylosporangium sp. NPDC050688 TaxID=3157217 RepID=UPI0033EF641F